MKKLYFLVVVLFVMGSVRGQVIDFTDLNLKDVLLSSDVSGNVAHDINYQAIVIDTNQDGEIQISEAQQVYHLSFSSMLIENFVGLEMFSNLKSLSIYQSNMVNMDISLISSLKNFHCTSAMMIQTLNVGSLDLEKISLSYVSLTSLDISNMASLNLIDITYTPLSVLDVSNKPLLEYFFCSSTNVTSLNFNNSPSLLILSATENPLTSLIVANSPLLHTLAAHANQLTTLDCSGSPLLEYLSLTQNQLTVLDISNNPEIASLYAGYNPFEKMFIKNGRYYPDLLYQNDADGNNLLGNLQYICADENNFALYAAQINTNFEINSYCSFKPGGTFYTINGSNTVDTNNNGCDSSDAILPNLKFNITNGVQTGSILSNQSGEYSIPVQEATHTITPILENPSYFTISPSTVEVTFPETTSPFTQNFCLTPNGLHPDLEVAILPTTPARPGFDAEYKIIIKNKGNIQQSGSVSFAYNDAILDYQIANPLFTTQTEGSLSWDFTNLEPFETREINLTLNVNSPMETPAVNGDDVLNYTATITSDQTDELPLDNVFSLPQIVVNSFDPNDKTCLEGTAITPDMIGKYVHYMIRFENTGTFAAENIVVKDMIDTAKFDVSSLVALNGSHPYVTRITGNKVEFIFEGINLPFEDATNDGYVVFKIKTLPSLALGDSFSNTASIYFDFNHPIVTEPAVTTFAVLGTEDFVFNNYFTLYPNPTNSILNITSKQDIELQSISIYNVLGQMVVSVPNAKGVNSVDVSSLSTGNYFIKVVSHKGTSNSKFIKQ